MLGSSPRKYPKSLSNLFGIFHAETHIIYICASKILARTCLASITIYIFMLLKIYYMSKQPKFEDMLREIIDAGNRSRRYLGINDETLRLLREVSGSVLTHKNEIVDGAMASLLQEEACLSVAQRAGLSAERARALFLYWLELVFTGGYDEKHSLHITKIGLAHVKAGVPPIFMINQMGAFAREILRRCSCDPKHLEAVMQALFWNLAVMARSYEMIRLMVFREATGISSEVYERLVHLYTKDAYSQLAKELGVG